MVFTDDKESNSLYPHKAEVPALPWPLPAGVRESQISMIQLLSDRVWTELFPTSYDEAPPSGPQTVTIFECRIKTVVIHENDTTKENCNSKWLASLFTKVQDGGKHRHTHRGKTLERNPQQLKERWAWGGPFPHRPLEGRFWTSSPQTPRQRISDRPPALQGFVVAALENGPTLQLSLTAPLVGQGSLFLASPFPLCPLTLLGH